MAVVGAHATERYEAPHRELLEKVVTHGALWASKIQEDKDST
jgi:hypothetical protein